LPLTIILFVYYNIERTESLKLREPNRGPGKPPLHIQTANA
jgi:hypothetical protein